MLIKSIRFFSNDHYSIKDMWHLTLQGITKSPQSPSLLEKVQLRHNKRFEKKSDSGFTVRLNPTSKQYEVAELVKNRQNKFSHINPMYLPHIKKDFSKHQSVSYFKPNTIMPQIFSPNRIDSNSGIIVDNENSLINRIMVYDQNTYSRPYDFTCIENARNFCESLNNGQSQYKYYKDFNELERFLVENQNGNKYSEVLARVRWSFDDKSMLYFSCPNTEQTSNTLYTRLVSQLRANDLVLCARRKNLIRDKNYFPKIFCYDNNIKKLVPYTREAMSLDLDIASSYQDRGADSVYYKVRNLAKCIKIQNKLLFTYRLYKEIQVDYETYFFMLSYHFYPETMSYFRIKECNLKIDFYELERLYLFQLNFITTCSYKSVFLKDPINGFNFSKKNLKYLYFTGITFENKSFLNSELKYTCFKKVDFINCDFSSANFEFSYFEEVNFTNCNFSKVNFSTTNFTGVDLSNAVLTGVKFTRATFDNVNLSVSNLSDADMSKTILTGVNLRNANCNNANFTDAVKTGCFY